MTATPTTPPTTFEAGTTVRFTQAPVMSAHGELSPPNGWTLTWLLRGISAVTVTASTVGTLWQVELTAALNVLAAGVYTSALRASKDGVVLPIGAPTKVTVTPDIADAAAGDLGDADERALRLLIAARDGTLTQGYLSVMVDGKQLQHFSLDQLERAIARYETKIARRRGGALSGHIGTVFVRR